MVIDGMGGALLVETGKGISSGTMLVIIMVTMIIITRHSFRLLSPGSGMKIVFRTHHGWWRDVSRDRLRSGLCHKVDKGEMSE